MPPRLPSIKKGERVIIAGRTGSGKSTLATWLLNRSPQRWIVLNPKHTVAYGELADNKTLEGFDARKLDDALEHYRFVTLNFAPAETTPEYMDGVISYLHDAYDNVGLCADELYTLHKNNRPGDGLTGWLTRGRERNQSFIGLTQRPAWISRFCFSESDAICAMSLQLAEDRKRMVDNTGRAELGTKLAPHHWAWYNVPEDALTVWGPVPLPKTGV